MTLWTRGRAPRCRFAFLIGVAIWGFDPGEAQAQPLSVVDSAGVSIVTSDPFSSNRRCTVGDEPRFSVGDALGDERYEFYSLRGMARLSDGSVAVIDRRDQRVRIFSEAGEFLRSMGGRGEGPGEFRNPWYLWALPGDTLWVGDYRPQRFNVFSPDGEFVRVVRLDPVYPNPSRGGGVLSNGTSINLRLDRENETDFKTPQTLFVEAHGPDGGLSGPRAHGRGAALRFRGECAQLQLRSPVRCRSPSVDAEGTTVAVTTGRDPEVRVLDEQFRLHRIIRWTDEDREVTRADVRAWREEYARQQRDRNLGDFAATRRPQTAALLERRTSGRRSLPGRRFRQCRPRRTDLGQTLPEAERDDRMAGLRTGGRLPLSFGSAAGAPDLRVRRRLHSGVAPGCPRHRVHRHVRTHCAGPAASELREGRPVTTV